MTANSNPNRMFLVIGTLIAAVLIGLAVFAVQGKPAAGTAEFDLQGVPFAGQDSAPVNVVVVEDFKCPVCKSFEETVAPELKTKYVDTGKVKMYSLLWPFLAEARSLPTDDSKLAAQASLCVADQGGNDPFNAFKAILFRAQGDENTVWATKTRLKELAGNLEDLDQSKYAECLDSDATAARVDAMEAQAVKARVTGTPTVFVNGQKVNATVADISAAIDAAN
ncbi:DsbA family protein [Deinococcus sedimenti]|uniref:Thioredoxin-like fold domain-containing protein n=1 Tax=Deinococcus sedimenti TaxID=1867090 RepID=A0ABQ2S2V3_9DEIO|nr:DsbA family protein [Deinococcus sedimenti]GGR91412.1 hypothetical protein GCM10008960_18040 [Deinococcus sedimenti]